MDVNAVSSQSEAQHRTAWCISRHLYKDGEPDQRVLSGQADQRNLSRSSGRGGEAEGEVREITPILPGAKSQCYINGRFDAVIEFDDGSYGIVDYKTSEAKDEQAAFYSRQLSAYAYALEHPAPNALGLSPISRLGLFVLTPDRFERTTNNDMVFVNKATWMDVPRDDEAFLALLGEVMAVLDTPTPPKSSEDCEVCNYRKDMQEFLAG